MDMEFAPSLFFWQLIVSELTILGIISLIIGFNSKEKDFLLYSVYTFFLLFYFILISPYEFGWLNQLYSTPFKSLRWYSQVIYNCAYFLFFLYFLNVRSHIYTFYKFIIRVVGFAFGIGTLVFMYTILTANSSLFTNFYIYIFVPILFCFAVYTLIRTLALPGALKYFFITGGGVFITLSMMALFFPIIGWSFLDMDSFMFFYIGVFTEQLVFAFGLAYKVKLMHKTLLKKSIENQQIKERQNQLLEIKLKEKENEILAITAKAEEDRISRLMSKFKDEINHLHLVSLQNQMNPHFIFNALNSIKALLIENDKQEAIYYLNKFSKLIRYILESVQVESISLEEELAILDLYVNLENIRFDEKINLKVENPENINLKNIFLPPMILQPFIENAIWHGLMLKRKEKRIDLIFSQIKNTTVLKIRDYGIGRQKAKQQEERNRFRKKSMGLKINNDRLTYFNQRNKLNYSFKINDLKNEKDEPTGTEIKMIFSTKQRIQE